MHPAQLLVYRFGPDANFEGRLVGALERIEVGGGVKIVDALFVASDRQTGDLVAIDLTSDGAGASIAPLLRFRLEPAERRRATDRTLGPHGSGVPAETVRQVWKTLEPGAAIVAVLIEHAWARALDDAVSRSAGTPLTNEFVGTTSLADLGRDLLAAATRDTGSAAGRR